MPKKSFDVWWSMQASALPARVDVATANYTLPSVPFTNCANDTWRTLYQDFPDPRYNHSAVWTGTEMIILGGNPGYPPSTQGR
jgi:hypothetical protein